MQELGSTNSIRTMEKDKQRSKIWDVIEVVVSLIVISLFLFLLYNSYRYFVMTFQIYRGDFKALSFYVGLMVAIATALMQWIEGRIKALVIAGNNLFGKDSAVVQIQDHKNKEVDNGRRKETKRKQRTKG